MAERTVPNSIRSLVGRNVSLWIGSVVETRRRKYVCGPWQNNSQLDVVWFWYHARRINKCCFGTWKCACAWVRSRCSRSPLQKQKSKSEHTLIIIKVITIIVKAKWLCAALIQLKKRQTKWWRRNGWRRRRKAKIELENYLRFGFYVTLRHYKPNERNKKKTNRSKTQNERIIIKIKRRNWIEKNRATIDSVIHLPWNIRF